MRQTLALAFITLMLLSSCKNGKSGESFFTTEETVEEDTTEVFSGDTLHLFEEKEPPLTVDELFIDFFFDFVGDMRFQKQRIHFPLTCTNEGESEHISRIAWVSADNRFAGHEFFSMVYEREDDDELQKDTTVSMVSVEWMNLQTDSITNYNFSRFNGLWVLTDIAKMPVGNHRNGDFLQFYSHFMTDSIYQAESLSRRLRLVLTPQNDEEETQIEELDAEQWSNLKADLPFNTTELITFDYGQQIGKSSYKTLFIEGLGNGFSMKLKFRKEDEQWKLHEVEY